MRKRRLKEHRKAFFGQIDDNGSRAVEYIAALHNSSFNGDAFQHLMMYMSTQKLRTPKGLEWLKLKFKTNEKNKVLTGLVMLRKLYCAI
jgi:3-deoxy-D-arabino-heptulosonate 7-phosphate (DAHP) synthase